MSVKFKIWFVYELRHRESGRRYFGSTSNPTERYASYRCGKDRGRKIGTAIELFGIEAFDFEIVEWFKDKRECFDFEKKMIRECDSVWPNGFNLVGGGRGTLRANMSPARHAAVTANSRRFWASEENRKKHKDAQSASEEYQNSQRRNGERIRALAALPEFSEKRIASLRGRKVSTETRAKIGDANRGRVHTAETRAKMAAAHLTPEYRSEASARKKKWWADRKLLEQKPPQGEA